MADVPKFRVWATIGWGYRYALKHLHLLFRAGWISLIILTIIFLSAPFTVAIWGEALVTQLLPAVIFAGSYLAVPWHRAILLNDTQPKTFRFRRAEFVYFAIALTPIAFSETIDFLYPDWGASFGALFVVLWCLVFNYLIILCCFMILPAVAIEDRSMTLTRVWRLWEGNRFRYLLFLILNSVIYSVCWQGVNMANFAFMRWLGAALDIDNSKTGILGVDFMKFMVAYGASSPLLAVILCFLMACCVGGVSISYAGIAKRGIEIDGRYDPPAALRDRISV